MWRDRGSAVSWAVCGAEGPAISVRAVTDSVFWGFFVCPVQLDRPQVWCQHQGLVPCRAEISQLSRPLPLAGKSVTIFYNFYLFCLFCTSLHLPCPEEHLFRSPWQQEKLLLSGCWVLLVPEFWFWACRQLQGLCSSREINRIRGWICSLPISAAFAALWGWLWCPAPSSREGFCIWCEISR